MQNIIYCHFNPEDYVRPHLTVSKVGNDPRGHVSMAIGEHQEIILFPPRNLDAEGKLEWIADLGRDIFNMAYDELAMMNQILKTPDREYAPPPEGALH